MFKSRVPLCVGIASYLFVCTALVGFSQSATAEEPILVLENASNVSYAGSWNGSGAPALVGWVPFSDIRVFSSSGETLQDISAFGNPPQAGVRSAVDVNNDGTPDVLTAFPGALYSGVSGELVFSLAADSSDFVGQMPDGRHAIVFGESDSFSPEGVQSGTVSLRNADDGSIRCELFGNHQGADFGQAVRGFPDYDGDGFADFLATQDGLGSTNPGESEVIIFSSSDCSELNSFFIPYMGPFSSSVALLNDIDHDGVTDFAAAHPAYVPGAPLGVYSGATGEQLYAIDNGPSSAGTIAPAGDFNGDGYQDFITSNPSAGVNKRGAAYVYSGLDGTLLRLYFDADLSSYVRLGNRVNRASDINNDGYDDVAVSVLTALGDDHGTQIFPGGPAANSETIRGDFNHDGTVNLADPIATLNYLFDHTAYAPILVEEADANMDGVIDMADAIYTLNELF